MLAGATVRDGLEFAIAKERFVEDCYHRLASNFRSDRELRELFQVLAGEEGERERELRLLLRSIPDGQNASSEKMALLQAMSVSEFFGSPSASVRPIKDITTREDALRRAVELEKATLCYYLALTEVLGEQPILQQMIRSKRSHLLQVSACLAATLRLTGPDSKRELR